METLQQYEEQMPHLLSKIDQYFWNDLQFQDDEFQLIVDRMNWLFSLESKGVSKL